MNIRFKRGLMASAAALGVFALVSLSWKLGYEQGLSPEQGEQADLSAPARPTELAAIPVPAPASPEVLVAPATPSALPEPLSEETVFAPPLEVAQSLPVAEADSYAAPVAVEQSVSRAQTRLAVPQTLGLASPEPYLFPGQRLPRDRFGAFESAPKKNVSDEPVSTFSIDVDTASYAVMRRALMAGNLPPKDSVRVEELINYFDYNYPLPQEKNPPFEVSVELFPSPWNEGRQLLHLGIKGHELVHETKPRTNLVFLVDVSGSMQSPDKLPLLVNALRLLVDNLAAEDQVAIVAYAGRSEIVLEPTEVKNKSVIFNALDQLVSGGGTAGALGISAAYALAEQNFLTDGVNRVILATDGDFNVGPHSPEALKALIEEKRESGVFLSVLGFGQGNYNDALMQALAQNGNGQAAYIDTLSEAQKVLVEEAAANLYPIAEDVKIQIEFNPATVVDYRLIGYETRALATEDFDNDKVDAGEIGSGHSVTAIYEITLADSPLLVETALRYQPVAEQEALTLVDSQEDPLNQELAFLKLRYKLPGADQSQKIERPVLLGEALEAWDEASTNARFSSAVAAFGQALRADPGKFSLSFDQIHDLAKKALGEDAYGYRREFLNLLRLAKSARLPALTPPIPLTQPYE